MRLLKVKAIEVDYDGRVRLVCKGERACQDFVVQVARYSPTYCSAVALNGTPEQWRDADTSVLPIVDLPPLGQNIAF